MRVSLPPGVRFVLAVILASCASVGLAGALWLWNSGPVPAYLLWNLFLAWVPFLVSLWLVRVLRRKEWSSWEGLAVSALWLIFLPNAFYMVSDFIHLADLSTEHVLFNAVVYTSFIALGVILGISSLYLVHRALRQRLGAGGGTAAVTAVLAICSVAIYIGRDLRWNSWDVVLDPSGVLFDLSSRLLRPSQYGPMLAVILPFFVLLCSLYWVVWLGIRALIHESHYRGGRTSGLPTKK